jgi:toxin-antitoxin system PIN domain toxin
VILVDANLLVYAHVNNLPQHFATKNWLDACLNASAPVGLPWPSLLGFLRIVTNSRIFERPESIKDAWQQIKEWLDCPPAWIPQPTERHAEILEGLLIDLNITANLVPDAHLATLAIEHGLILCSADGDFGRFPDLKWQNPLQSVTR